MRQVNRDELIHILQDGMRTWTASLLNEFRHHDPDKRVRARIIAAGLLADRLKRLEILSDAVEPPGFKHISPNDPLTLVPHRGVLDAVGSKSPIPGNG